MLLMTDQEEVPRDTSTEVTPENVESVQEALLPEADEPAVESPLSPAPARPLKNSKWSFLEIGYLVQVVMILVALTLGGFLDSPPWSLFDWSWQSILVGTLGTLPLIVLIFGIEKIPIESLRKIEEFLIEKVAPLLSTASLKELFVLGSSLASVRNFSFGES
ncbi:MAG: hypothetical protein R3C11_10770 [Planctomycetaceae bacterium]